MTETDYGRKFYSQLLWKKNKIDRLDTPEGRFYVDQEGNRYPNVTSIVSQINADSIADWRERVGFDEAEKIRVQAANRGSDLHDLLEKYVANDIDWDRDAMPTAVENFLRLVPFLEKRLKAVAACEYRLVSKFLGAGGTADLVGLWYTNDEWKPKVTVLDLKTTRKFKGRDKYGHYFIQAGTYGMMINEQFKKPVVEHICIMLLPDDGPVQLLEGSLKDWQPAVIDLFKPFDKKMDTAN